MLEMIVNLLRIVVLLLMMVYFVYRLIGSIRSYKESKFLLEKLKENLKEQQKITDVMKEDIGTLEEEEEHEMGIGERN